jgi:hypothetical protein
MTQKTIAGVQMPLKAAGKGFTLAGKPISSECLSALIKGLEKASRLAPTCGRRK